jgi:hypothetical protein
VGRIRKSVLKDAAAVPVQFYRNRSVAAALRPTARG